MAFNLGSNINFSIDQALIDQYSGQLNKTLPTNSLQAQNVAKMGQVATQSQSAGEGIIQGALAGAPLGTPGAIIGGAVGGLSGALSARQKDREEKIEAQIGHQRNLVTIEGTKNQLRQSIMQNLASNLSVTLNRR